MASQTVSLHWTSALIHSLDSITQLFWFPNFTALSCFIMLYHALSPTKPSQNIPTRQSWRLHQHHSSSHVHCPFCTHRIPSPCGCSAHDLVACPAWSEGVRVPTKATRETFTHAIRDTQCRSNAANIVLGSVHIKSVRYIDPLTCQTSWAIDFSWLFPVAQTKIGSGSSHRRMNISDISDPVPAVPNWSLDIPYRGMVLF